MTKKFLMIKSTFLQAAPNQYDISIFFKLEAFTKSNVYNPFLPCQCICIVKFICLCIPIVDSIPELFSYTSIVKKMMIIC